MKYVSIDARAHAADLQTALFEATAPDGSLYMPVPLTPLPDERVAQFRGAGLQETALRVLGHLVREDIGDAVLQRIVNAALDFPIPLVRLDERLYVLELFHGPTLAFKDVGARVMARLMASYRAARDGDITVLAATSGDTGGAVAHAFLGVPGFRVVILFPRGRVSQRQERQFSTLGGNVQALGVDGTFDDCQRLVRISFADGSLRREVRLTSANSINVGRLLPQIAYFFHAWSQLPGGATQVVCSTPSGNFGNLTAGLMAKRLGVPIHHFIAATNINRVVPDYLDTGDFRPRPAAPTLSTAMDVGNPSNFARILALYDGDLGRIRADLSGSAHTDAETVAGIKAAHERYGYVLDPHSAVGYVALQAYLGRHAGAVGMLLATAHPAKFAETVEPVVGRRVQVPDRLACCLDREPHVTPLQTDFAALRAVLANK